MKKQIRNLIIGEDKFIESQGEFKQVMLSGQYALAAILLCLMYFFIDLSVGQYESLPVFCLAIFLLGLSIFIHRQGDHCLANYFLLPTINITVYLFAASETPHTGVFVFFIINSIAAFAVFSYKQRLLSILFAIFTYFLFVMAYFVDFSILPERQYDEMTILFNVVVNFSIALPAAVMSVYLLISLNHYNARKLVDSNKLLVKTNEELDRFVYSTSHDLRAPLTSVMGLIDIVNRTEDIHEIKRYTGMMKDRVNSLDKFIKDITDYSRNNRMEIARDKVKLSGLAEEVWESLKYAPEANGIDFHLEIPDSVEIQSDKNRLKIILSNLIANSIRYHDSHKEQKYIRLKHQFNGKGIYLKIEDNGQGIAPEYQAKVFDMFYRAHEKSQGSGLGLYIVKETLTKISGTVRLESEPGVGTTFTLKLPY